MYQLTERGMKRAVAIAAILADFAEQPEVISRINDILGEADTVPDLASDVMDLGAVLFAAHLMEELRGGPLLPEEIRTAAVALAERLTAGSEKSDEPKPSRLRVVSSDD